ncbi:mitochondrial protein, putative [Babesia caballi]|uniref:Mitochondrial protein, putative n=1 Tax=Babesia caballi TaxID=5871 RepID=A0AAV4LX73_BABCB|nr:mitochondrial protein, putative [Babesia caballi]
MTRKVRRDRRAQPKPSRNAHDLRLDSVADVEGLGGDGLPDGLDEGLGVLLAALDLLLGLGGPGLDTSESLLAQLTLHELEHLLRAAALDDRLGVALLRRTQDSLHRSRVDEGAEVGVLEEPGGHDLEVVVDGLEGRLAPDAQPTQVAGRGQLEEVQPLNRGDLDTWNVPEGPPALDGGRPEDNEGAHGPLLLAIPAMAPDLAHPLELRSQTHRLQELDGVLGLVQLLNRVVHHHGHLAQRLNAVSPRHDDRYDGRGRHSRSQRLPLLLEVDLAVPPPPDAGRRVHATGAAEVGVGSLAGPVGATTLDAGHTRHGAPSTPTPGRGLVARHLAHGVGLPPVLGHVGVDRSHKVEPQRR